MSLFQPTFIFGTIKPKDTVSSVPSVEERVTEEDSSNEKSAAEDHAILPSISQLLGLTAKIFVIVIKK